MAYPRRRYFSHIHSRRLLPATAGAILLLFSLLSFLAPPPVDLLYHRHHSISRHHVLRGNDVPGESTTETTFNIRTNGGVLDRDLWTSRTSNLYRGCSNSSKYFAKAEFVTHPNRYLLIATSGGLNQQRTGITDAVVAARILNATLVVPKLDQKSFWKDTSTFSEIFNVDWFISFLSKDVEILKQLPKAGGRRGRPLIPYTMHVPRKCSPRCYHNRVLPVLIKKHAVQLTKFDYRLANKLETDLQKLRCRVNYHALRFTDPILEMGRTLVHRMRMKSKHYIALHLRFESDMLAFSGCYYGGGEKERRELGALRKRWKTLHIRNPDRERRQGKCPLTPEEVGLMLRGLGYGDDVHIYVASGEVYGGEETLAPLKKLFPNFHSKESIATNEELRPFCSFSSRMAALDFIVCNESDVFVTNNNGNMARILAGQRRYFGHMRTIRPNAKKLYRLFLSRENSTWEVFSSRVRSFQRGFMGEPEEVRPGRGEFHENPSSCICKTPGAKKTVRVPDSFIQNQNDYDDGDDDNDGDDDLENGMFNVTESDNEMLNSDEPELEEILSD